MSLQEGKIGWAIQHRDPKKITPFYQDAVEDSSLLLIIPIPIIPTLTTAASNSGVVLDTCSLFFAITSIFTTISSHIFPTILSHICCFHSQLVMSSCAGTLTGEVPKDPMGVKGKTPIAFGGGEVLGSGFDARWGRGSCCGRGWFWFFDGWILWRFYGVFGDFLGIFWGFVVGFEGNDWDFTGISWGFDRI